MKIQHISTTDIEYSYSCTNKQKFDFIQYTL